MAPFWSGIAIGLGISLALFLVLAVLFVIIYVAEWLLVILAALYVVARDGMRVERARIDAARAELGLSPFHRAARIRFSQCAVPGACCAIRFASGPSSPSRSTRGKIPLPISGATVSPDRSSLFRALALNGDNCVAPGGDLPQVPFPSARCR